MHVDDEKIPCTLDSHTVRKKGRSSELGDSAIAASPRFFRGFARSRKGPRRIPVASFRANRLKEESVEAIGVVRILCVYCTASLAMLRPKHDLSNWIRSP